MFRTIATALPGRGTPVADTRFAVHAAPRAGGVALAATLSTLCLAGIVGFAWSGAGLIGWRALAPTAAPPSNQAYEERIAALRSEIDRLSSSHNVATQSLGDQVATLLRRQDELIRRQAELGGLVGKAKSDGLDAAATDTPAIERARAEADMGSASIPTETGEAGREPSDDPSILDYAPADGDLESPASSPPQRPAALLEAPFRPALTGQPAQAGVDSVRSSLDKIETEQTAMLSELETASSAATQRIGAALAPLRLVRMAAALRNASDHEAEGGPFIPAAELRFVERTALLDRQLADLAELRRSVAALPLRAPLSASRVSSTFGYRDDPFLNRPALHAGIDFVAPEGSLVRATAPGTVVSAGWSGGYGQMVEVRHADGLSTRYGHLSAVLVTPGSRVAAGSVVGRVGSTGRSTGPHLHYETRRDDVATDPAPFLAAGRVVL